MAYLIYYTDTTRLVSDKLFATEGSAKGARTRRQKKYPKSERVMEIAEAKHYYQKIEKQVERVNLVSGEKYTESINTPACCSPATETYWSM